jgi:hypothetical protein
MTLLHGPANGPFISRIGSPHDQKPAGTCDGWGLGRADLQHASPNRRHCVDSRRENDREGASNLKGGLGNVRIQNSPGPIP